MRRRTFLAGLGAGAASLAGCTASGSSEYDVGMSSSAFVPAQITVSAGETVVWENTSARPHTVTLYEGSHPEGAEYFASGGFDSEQAARDAWPGAGGIVSGETYSHTFELPGEYVYFCIPHEPARMVGTVTVTEE